MDRLLANITVHGSAESIYGTDTWSIDVWYDGRDVYTVDPMEDVDVIGHADTLQEAVAFAREYFAGNGYEYFETPPWTDEIDAAWSRYDQDVAKCMLDTYGFVFLDEYGLPIDDEYDQEEAYWEFVRIYSVEA